MFPIRWIITIEINSPRLIWLVFYHSQGVKQSLSKSNTPPHSSSISPGIGVGGRSCDTLFTLILISLADLGLVNFTCLSSGGLSAAVFTIYRIRNENPVTSYLADSVVLHYGR